MLRKKNKEKRKGIFCVDGRKKLIDGVIGKRAKLYDLIGKQMVQERHLEM